MSHSVSAPGSLMLLGEYAVLHGKPALVCAVDKRITVTLTPRKDNKILLTSARLGEMETQRGKIQITKPFQFVLSVLERYQTHFPSGCDIKIESEFSDQVGLGSSSAVTVATLGAVWSWLGRPLDPFQVMKTARELIRKVQGLGSGADVAASVYGGLVAYRIRPLSAEKISVAHPITLIYSGAKTPTVVAVQKVQHTFGAYPKLFQHIISAISECARLGIECARKEQWSALGKIMTFQQGLMTALTVNTPELQKIVEELQSDPAILGAKISGSGLGDCVVALGETSKTFANAIPVAITTQGITIDEQI